ncbi:hypothetical protein [Thermoanaerobacterium sp. RBIITD]|uniref:hypothetical protein n=1 Tax=Thermoanaerobacterium sp. RBIITD TaxID=1550240 RepID=UPI000BC0A125|nr:hypothetical protein [Thermoanaerobacterium sp. RBIITD]SNX55314.1 hypothetical protein SAMN05660242_3136 [Thermoanaerobacterium sp. RBIITD]
MRKIFLIILTMLIILTNTLIIPHKYMAFKQIPQKYLVADEAGPGVLIEKALG